MTCDEIKQLQNDVVALAPELSFVINDGAGQARFNMAYQLATLNVSETAFGNRYGLALALYIAHVLTLQNAVSQQGAMGAGITQGAIQSEKEGDLEVSYGAVAGASNADDLFNKTYYGKLYLDLRRKCVFTVMTRLG
nr:MAG TPA: head to tail adaptor [Caudoviricetes sp.]